MRKKILSILMIIYVLSVPCFAAPNFGLQSPVNFVPTGMFDNSYQTQGFDASRLRASVVKVPANTSFSASVMSSLSSRTSRLGDKVVFYLSSDFYYGNTLIASAGSRINGAVILAKKGTPEKKGQLQVKFTNIVTPSGMMIPLHASVKTEDGTGIMKVEFESETENAEDNQTAKKNIIVRGDDIEISQGAHFTIVLDQPITISSNTPY